ncbi:uncharacterized protein LOC114257331 isoform X1 [Camellia sinensis]|uniref:uncharacterized protein LOC114257331 isoform X1 n=1 Tax=Camellia sinensis TaxID=4442 RepID=UPI001035BE31|nr:uncharacterized protein LOC114257331 isoform X1 [Camellia sinensis]
MDGQRSYLSNLVLVLLPSGSSISNSPIASCSLSVIPAHGETGVVEERFRLNAKRRREYTGSLESVSQIDCRSSTAKRTVEVFFVVFFFLFRQQHLFTSKPSDQQVVFIFSIPFFVFPPESMDISHVS